MILALDTSTAACTAALLEPDGTIVASRDEVIGRGHAERLVPMIEEMLDGHVPSRLLVGVGPGSFTGLRVGIAAAHGMAIGWSIPLAGMNTLALLAASAPPGEGKVAAAMTGGHGELFVQTFDRKKLTATGPILNLTPGRRGDQGRCSAGRRQRRRRAGRGPPVPARHCRCCPPPAGRSSCRNCSECSSASQSTPARPMRGPRRHDGDHAAKRSTRVRLRPGRVDDLDDVMRIMSGAFQPCFGEAWTRSQCAGILPMSGRRPDRRREMIGVLSDFRWSGLSRTRRSCC